MIYDMGIDIEIMAIRLTNAWRMAWKVTLAIVLAVALFGCGGVRISVTNYYTVNGNDNKLGQTIRTDSKPDITATTNASATVPVL